MSAAKSQTTKIKRGAAPVRRPRPVVKKVKAPVKKGPSWVARMLVALHISPAMIQRATMVLIFTVIATIAAAAAQYSGLTKLAARSAADAVGRAGFTVKHIEIEGLNHMDRDTVYGIVTDASSMSMANVDLTGIRQKLMSYGWIAEAQVTRRLPDTLLIAVTERQPAAVWQYNQHLSLVDAKGLVLEPVTAQNMPTDVPLIIGPDANKQAAAMVGLLDAAPRLKPQVAGASWIGNRRWDVRFQTGETLALPEGAAEAAKALTAFADTDAAHPLLGKGYARFDARDGTHLLIKFAPKSGDNGATTTGNAQRHSASNPNAGDG